MEESPEIVLPIQGLRNIKAIAHDTIDGHIYWIDGRTKTIKRALDNGTDVSCLFKMNSTLLDNLFFISFKFQIKIFWHASLQAAVVIHNPQSQDLYNPYDIAIDSFSRHLYWSDSMNNVINVTRLDMRAVGVVIKGSHQKPRSIALAPEKG